MKQCFKNDPISPFFEMKEICKQNGFACRGKAFFRVIGDGVLQVLDYHKERVYKNPVIGIGLFSLYGEIEDQWLRSYGCIPRYHLYRLFVPRKPLQGNHWDKETMLEIINGAQPELQVAVLEEQGMPWLNTITTQEKLVESMCQLDALDGYSIKLGDILEYTPSQLDNKANLSFIWNDELKFAPFLKAGQLHYAQKVVESILLQHADAAESRKKYMDHEEHQEYLRDLAHRDAPFIEKLGMVKKNDLNAIQNYLHTNFVKNCKMTAFCKQKL